jgi:hypothetical protein
MKDLHPVEVCLLVAMALCWASLELVRALFALLALAGPGPGASAPAPRPAPLPVVITPAPAPVAAVAPLQSLTVAQLRTRARAAGLPRLARSGRRAELLLALG